jgi:hypothetical protein
MFGKNGPPTAGVRLNARRLVGANFPASEQGVATH